jgi:hypothetical protein
VRVAVSGSHGVGKSTLIAAFLGRHPEYAHEPEAFEVMADEIDLTESGAPTPDGLRTLLDYTVSALEGRSVQPNVVFERSPLDYLAYAAASGSAWPRGEKRRLLATHSAVVRSSIRHLDLVAFLPLSPMGPGRRRGEDGRFRRRVDHWMRRVLVDDVYGLFADGRTPRVVELPAEPDRQLASLSSSVEAANR